jgi:hypothetical protein
LTGAKSIQKNVISPPGLPATAAIPSPAKTKQEEISRRRKEIAEAGGGDPDSTSAMLAAAFKNTAKAIPVLIKKYWWIALIT